MEKKAIRILNCYIKHKKAENSRIEFYKRLDVDYDISDFLNALEEDSRDKARELIGDDTELLLQVVYTLLSACCRRLLMITFNNKTSTGSSIIMKSPRNLRPIVIKSSFFETSYPGFMALTSEERKKYFFGKGILLSTVFYMPECIQEAMTGLFEFLDVIRTLLDMDGSKE